MSTTNLDELRDILRGGTLGIDGMPDWIADGIERSGLIGAALSTQIKTSADLATLGAMLGGSLSRVADQLSLMNNTLNSIAWSVANPVSTTSLEAYRKALNLLNRKLYPEAIQRLEEALALDPDVASYQAAYGVALLAEDKNTDAGAALTAAVRYANNEPALATGAAILGARCLLEAGQANQAANLLRDAQRHSPDHPQILLNLAVITGDQDLTERALSQDPRLALPSLAMRAPAAADIISSWVFSESSAFADARAIASLAEDDELISEMDQLARVPDAERTAAAVTIAMDRLPGVVSALHQRLLREEQIVLDQEKRVASERQNYEFHVARRREALTQQSEVKAEARRDVTKGLALLFGGLGSMAGSFLWYQSDPGSGLIFLPQFFGFLAFIAGIFMTPWSRVFGAGERRAVPPVPEPPTEVPVDPAAREKARVALSAAEAVQRRYPVPLHPWSGTYAEQHPALS